MEAPIDRRRRIHMKTEEEQLYRRRILRSFEVERLSSVPKLLGIRRKEDLPYETRLLLTPQFEDLMFGVVPKGGVRCLLDWRHMRRAMGLAAPCKGNFISESFPIAFPELFGMQCSVVAPSIKENKGTYCDAGCSERVQAAASAIHSAINSIFMDDPMSDTYSTLFEEE